MAHILVVEDNTDLREMLCESLEHENHAACGVSTVHKARTELSSQDFDLIILDWMLPEISGLQWLKQLRESEQHASTRIIMLTAKSEISDRVEGLDAGADDYLVKPFSLIELQARVRAQLKKHSGAENLEVIKLGGLILEQSSQRVRAGKETIKLGPTEYRLLLHLMQHPEHVFSRAQLLDSVWGLQVFVEERTVDVHIRRLRKALESQNKQQLVQTVRGSGYRFSAEAQS